ncbi:MAG: glycine cleavage system H protein [Natronomonas sp.]|jgi:glycine cleavage system H protein|uniref:glycine cleavage system protein GcvH n=1 Tax=Natronomonas sp. TaxID=2184060 RepID=UPI00398951BF
MRFEIPEDCRYLETHEWARRRGEHLRIGVTDFAQDELGDVVFIELPAVGDRIEAGTPFGVVESIKAVSDLYAPVSGEVTAVNGDVVDAPDRLNQDPFGEGWLLDIDPADDSGFDDLLSPEEYEAQIE